MVRPDQTLKIDRRILAQAISTLEACRRLLGIKGTSNQTVIMIQLECSIEQLSGIIKSDGA